MVKTYTICLTGLENRKVIVVGGGKIAARKVQTLHEDGAVVILISPVVEPELAELSQRGSLVLHLRKYQAGDLKGAFLAIAATNDHDVNCCVWEEATREGCLINVVDDPAHSNFIMPAVVRRGDLKLAITTGGSSPALARILRMKLEKQFGPEYEKLVGLLEHRRPEFLARFESMEARFQAMERLLETDVLELLQKNEWDAAVKLIDETILM